MLLPGRLLGDVVRSLPPGDVDAGAAAGAARRRAHRRRARASTCARCRPRTSRACRSSRATRRSCPPRPLAETIDRVARAASRDEVRPILTGVLFQAEGTTLTMVATDSYRLSVKHTELESAARRAGRGERPGAGAARAGADHRPGGRRGGRDLAGPQPGGLPGRPVVLSSRLIEGQFPSWRQLIPESFEHEVRLPREELLEVARRISQLAQRNAPLRFAFAEGELTVAAETPGDRRRERGDAGAVLGRAAGDRLQPAVPDRGARERRRPTSW